MDQGGRGRGELLGNTTFDTTSSLGAWQATIASVAGGQPGNALQLTTVNSIGAAGETFTVPSGALLLFTSYAKLGTAVAWTVSVAIQENGGAYADLNATFIGSSSWGQYSIYATADMTTMEGAFAVGGMGLTGLFDTASMKQVTAPSTTGVTIVSASGGSTQNWTSEASGFNRNDSGGYTYAITKS